MGEREGVGERERKVDKRVNEVCSNMPSGITVPKHIGITSPGSELMTAGACSNSVDLTVRYNLGKGQGPGKFLVLLIHSYNRSVLLWASPLFSKRSTVEQSGRPRPLGGRALLTESR